MKQRTLALAVILIFVQLAVPFGMIAQREITDLKVEQYGEEHKFKIDIHSIWDTGINYSLTENDFNYSGKGERYGTVIKDSSGFSHIATLSDKKPESGTYIKSAAKNYFDFGNGIYSLKTIIDTSLAEELNNKYSGGYNLWGDNKQEYIGNSQSTYITVKIYKGHAEITGLVIGDYIF